MNNEIHQGTKFARTIGVLLGVFIIVSFLAPKSEPSTPTILSRLGDAMLMLYGVVLAIPWRKIKTKALWMILFLFYICFSLVFIGGQIKDCLWAAREGEPLQKIMFPMWTLIFGMVVSIQAPAILTIRNSNQRIDPTLKTAG